MKGIEPSFTSLRMDNSLGRCKSDVKERPCTLPNVMIYVRAVLMVSMMEQHLIQASPIKDFAAF